MDRLSDEISEMNLLVKSAIFNSLEALASRNIEHSLQIIQDDDLIDNKRQLIEQLCINIIRREAPLASDLRTIISILLITGELERIGDYAEGISTISVAIGDTPLIKKLIDIPKMASIATDLLKLSISIFFNSPNIENVKKTSSFVSEADQQVNSLYAEVRKDIISIIKESPHMADNGIHILSVAHNIERIADRAKNISERALYRYSGVIQ